MVLGIQTCPLSHQPQVAKAYRPLHKSVGVPADRFSVAERHEGILGTLRGIGVLAGTNYGDEELVASVVLLAHGESSFLRHCRKSSQY